MEEGVKTKFYNEEFEKHKYSRWLLVIMGTLVMFFISLCNAWSMLIKPIAVEYPEWRAGLMMGLTVFMISYSLSGVVSGIIIGKRKGDARLNLIISALLLFSSFMISSLVKNLFLLYFSFGVLGGAGAVFAYNSILSVVTRWFQDMWGVISGTLLMGYGLGAFTIGKLYAFLLSFNIDWRVIFFAFGIGLAIIIIIASFILVLPPEGYKAPDARKPKIDKHPIETLECTPLQMLKRPSFWLNFIGGGCFLTMPTMAMNSAAQQIVEGIAPTLALTDIATIVGLISIFNAVGRIATGFLNDWAGLRANMVISATLVVLATFNMVLAVYVANLTYLIISYVLFGFATGMSVPDGAVAIQTFFGKKHYQTNIQVLMTAGIVNSMGAIIMPLLFNLAGTYVISLLVISLVACIGWVCIFLLKKP